MAAAYGAGQTIIADKYKQMAESKQTLRTFNNVAAFFISVFIATQLGINAIPTRENQLSVREMSTVCFEFASWMLFMTGLGWGQARRERDWLLRTAIIMSAGALAAQIVTLAPSRIKELVDLALNFKGASDFGTLVQLGGGFAQFGAFAARSAAVGSASTYLTSKRAAQQQRQKTVQTGDAKGKR